MDGRLTIEDGDILDLLTMVTGAEPLGGRRQAAARSMQRGQEG